MPIKGTKYHRVYIGSILFLQFVFESKILLAEWDEVVNYSPTWKIALRYSKKKWTCHFGHWHIIYQVRGKNVWLNGWPKIGLRTLVIMLLKCTVSCHGFIYAPVDFLNCKTEKKLQQQRSSRPFSEFVTASSLWWHFPLNSPFKHLLTSRTSHILKACNHFLS